MPRVVSSSSCSRGAGLEVVSGAFVGVLCCKVIVGTTRRQVDSCLELLALVPEIQTAQLRTEFIVGAGRLSWVDCLVVLRCVVVCGLSHVVQMRIA